MPRKPRPLERIERVRDANLVIIASEDTYAVKGYFAKFHSSKTHVRILETNDGRSSPSDVLKRLDNYTEEYDLDFSIDELWIAIDADHWIKGHHVSNLKQVLQECRQKGYQAAISNPCIELWFLLHYTDAADSYENCNEVADCLIAAAGCGNKKSIMALDITLDQVSEAIQRARSLDIDPKHDIPEYVISRMYLIVQGMIDKGEITIL